MTSKSKRSAIVTMEDVSLEDVSWGMSEEKGRKREWEKREEEGGGLKKKEGMREERREEGTQSQKERSEGKGRLEIVDGRKERRREANKNSISSLSLTTAVNRG